MPHADKPTVSIVGAGLAGPLMMNLLAQSGYRVTLFERRSDPRKSEAGPGRSINLALSVRGIHALERVGLAKDVLAAAVPMRGRMIHDIDGHLSFQPYSKNEKEVINSVSRGGLNITLLEAVAKNPDIRVVFDHKCTDVDPDTGAATLIDNVTGETTVCDGDILIGADGAFSAVRGRLQRMDRFNYRQDYLGHGYKELTIPPGPNGSFQMEKHALHIWPRRSFMMIALPNAEGSFTCTLFWPFEGPFGFDNLKTHECVTRFFRQYFPDAVGLMPTLADDYFTHPTSSLVTVRCDPWYVRDKVVMIGDACHAVVPFYGQGINAGFETCVILHQCIRKYAPDLERAFAAYQKSRKKHTDTLAELAIGNFREMRDHVGSPAFLRKKKRERLLHRLFPNWYKPLYSMVTFSRTPYADAVERAVRQERMIRRAFRAVVALLVILVLGLIFVLL